MSRSRPRASHPGRSRFEDGPGRDAGQQVSILARLLPASWCVTPRFDAGAEAPLTTGRPELRASSRGLAAIVLAISLAGGLASSLAGQTAVRLDLSGERSRVTSAGTRSTWEALRVGVGVVDLARGGCYGALERQKRSQLVEATGSASCYRRLGDWTVAGGVGVTPEADFLYRVSAEGHLSRRLAGTVVGSLGYRYLDYPTSVVHQVQPAITWYHPRGEVEGRVYLTSNRARDRTSATGLIRALHDLTSRVRLAGGFSYGDRIFDIASLPQGDQRAWQVYGWTRLGITPRDFATVGFAVAHERPAFDIRTWQLGYRREF